MSIGHQVIEYIISSNLVSPRCAHDETHGVINVWSSQAPEQLEAFIEQLIDESKCEGCEKVIKDDEESFYDDDGIKLCKNCYETCEEEPL